MYLNLKLYKPQGSTCVGGVNDDGQKTNGNSLGMGANLGIVVFVLLSKYSRPNSRGMRLED